MRARFQAAIAQRLRPCHSLQLVLKVTNVRFVFYVPADTFHPTVNADLPIVSPAQRKGAEASARGFCRGNHVSTF
jgi:hypothetical protein